MKGQGCVVVLLFWLTPCVWGDQTSSYHEGAQQAREMKQKALNGEHLLEANASKNIPNYKPVEERTEQTFNSQSYESMMKDVVRTQLGSDRVRIDPNTDPIFVNANRAIEKPEETLKKQTVSYTEEKDYEEKECIDTRDEEFEAVNTAHVDPYYKRFEVNMYYNSCPNHSGWGKVAAASCGNKHLHQLNRRSDLDYDEIHGMEWREDKHPDLDYLFSNGKCRLKKEMPKDEGRESRMIPVEFYRKDETMSDWTISKIDEHREGRSRLKGPQDFGVESFVKVQVFICSYKTPGNTCTTLRAQGGIEKTSSCSERVGDVCVKWQKTYKVPKPGTVHTTKTTDLSAGHIEPFNMDGRMNDKTFVENKEAPEAIARLTALHEVGAAMPKIDTGNPDSIGVFNGEAITCLTQGGSLSHHGCPGQSGKKDPHEQKLEQLDREGKCIRVGSYKKDEKTNIGQMIGQKATITSYCCFESLLSKALHQGAITCGLRTIGDGVAKNPPCQALTLGELQRMDWSRVDFGPFVAEMTSKVNLNAGHIANKSSTTVHSHLSNQMAAAQSARMREQAEASRVRSLGGGS
jgi:hypothetical protein